MTEKRYVIVVQCHIVKERCSGFLCEHAFHERKDCFSDYKNNKDLRFLTMTCGGCCGLATLRKLQNFISIAKKKDGISKDEIVVHLSSCASFESYHGPECPHKDYLSELITKKAGLDLVYGSRLSQNTEAKREKGEYKAR